MPVLNLQTIWKNQPELKRVPAENSHSPRVSISYKQLFLHYLAGIKMYCEAKEMYEVLNKTMCSL